MIPHSIYCDGGVIRSNPSPIGGTFAWVWIDEEGNELKRDSGIITPKMSGKPKVSNNLTELWAAIEALSSVPIGWKGTLHTDSLVTLRRITNGMKFNGIPAPMRLKTLDLRRIRNYAVVLVSGHPTKKELENGISKKGRMVSKWNVLCDQLCRELADSYSTIKKS